MRSRVWVALTLLSIVAVAVASAQNSPVLGRVNIPFKFMVGKTEMPSGKYELVKQEAQQSTLVLHNLDNNKSTYLHVIEQLAETNPSAKHKAKVVFDEVGEHRFISECWPADNGDGYLVGVTKGEQKHVIVTQD
jgi:hypothetical protein